MKQPHQEFTVDQLRVQVFGGRDAMGASAASSVARAMAARQTSGGTVRMVFAAAPSQNELLAALTEDQTIDWSSVTAFHMDEYLGLSPQAPQLFGHYLRRHLFQKVPFAEVHFIDPSPVDVDDECRRYAALISHAPIDIVCLGIGENGHIAFNDPPVADFEDPATIKAVRLDLACRQQQVNDGCFATLQQVPSQALTLTVPALMSARQLFVVVPGPAKAAAVAQALRGPVATSCPASALRRHPDARLFLDAAAAADL